MYSATLLQSISYVRAYEVLQVLGASLLIALFSQIQIPLPFTPVPISLQTLAVLIVGATLGSKKGSLAVLLYFGEILIGLPVLAGGMIAPWAFIGAKGGYIVGFLIQAYLMGAFIERESTFSVSRTLFAACGVCIVQLALGVLWLSHFVGWNHMLLAGFYPFLPGEALKCVAIVAYLKRQNS